MAKVRANRFFQTEGIGAKEEGETFDYDVEKDPHDMVKLGYIDHGKAKVAEQPQT